MLNCKNRVLLGCSDGGNRMPTNMDAEYRCRWKDDTQQLPHKLIIDCPQSRDLLQVLSGRQRRNRFEARKEASGIRIIPKNLERISSNKMAVVINLHLRIMRFKKRDKVSKQYLAAMAQRRCQSEDNTGLTRCFVAQGTVFQTFRQNHVKFGDVNGSCRETCRC